MRKETFYSGCCGAEDISRAGGDTHFGDMGECPECGCNTTFHSESELEDKYRPSLAAFRRDVTVEDALGVTCVVMIVLCAVAVWGGISQ